MNRRTRKTLTQFRLLHPRSDVNRIYIPRRLGGRGLRQIEDSYIISILRQAEYLKNKKDSDSLVALIHKYLLNMKTNKNVLKEARNYETKLNSDGIFIDHEQNLKWFKDKIKKKYILNQEEKWKQKPLHGQFKRNMDSDIAVDSIKSFDWLKYGKIKGESEGYLIAAQEKILRKIHNENKYR